ncbi:hypothetical protein NDA01_28595 [Trichocoleus desertorum AS-A10]|uniref:hypothetical protein n=1 Tax=Trichocoleus desertorum TaxID=1481672 RepID=UPI00329827F1
MDAENNDKIIPVNSLMDTICNSDLTAISSDIAEALLDQSLQEGIVHDVPILGSLINILKVGRTIQDRIFLKKVLQFLHQLQDVPPDKRLRFSEQIANDPKFRERIGSNLILWIQRLDDMEKPNLLGRIFKAYIDGGIDYPTYEKLALAVDRVKIQSLNGLAEFYGKYDGTTYDSLSESKHNLPNDVIQDLIVSGLIDIRFMPSILTTSPNFDSGVTRIGKLFVEIALESP